MRGGALPLLVWGALLAVLGAINWIWTGDAIQVGTFGFAILAVAGSVALLAVLGCDALRPGAPEPRGDPEAIPDASMGAVLAGLSIGSILFGFAFGKFPIYFGSGMLLVSLGRIAIEVRAQRRNQRTVQERRQ